MKQLFLSLIAISSLHIGLVRADNDPYGITYVNNQTNESVSMVCADAGVDFYKCKNFSVVRNRNGSINQLVEKTMSKSSVETLNLKVASAQELSALEDKISRLKNQGYKFISVRGTINDQHYRFGAGLGQMMTKELDDIVGAFYVIPLMEGLWALDTTVEASKHVLNTVIWPVKAISNRIKIMKEKKKLKELSKRVELVAELINPDEDGSLPGKFKTISADKYKQLISDLKIVTLNAK